MQTFFTVRFSIFLGTGLWSGTHLEREAREVHGCAESEAWREERGEQDVAAVLGAAEALVRAVPRALGAVHALGLAHNVIPHHLGRKKKTERMIEVTLEAL